MQLLQSGMLLLQWVWLAQRRAQPNFKQWALKLCEEIWSNLRSSPKLPLQVCALQDSSKQEGLSKFAQVYINVAASILH